LPPARLRGSRHQRLPPRGLNPHRCGRRKMPCGVARAKGAPVAESITITDNRSGQAVEIPIEDGGVSAAAWSKLLPGIWFYDPGFTSTAACESSVTFLDGEAGILRYRGYPIEELAERSSYLEVAYLLLKGELPTASEFDAWRREITHHTFIHE